MSFLNSNLVHNVLNVAMALNAIVLWAGCSTTVNGVTSCTQAWIPPGIAIILIALGAALKLVINIGRDGLAGLVKQQPPVADAMTTVVQPVKTVNVGDKVAVTATTTATAKK
jgi:hypothetical protein